jgi:putative peptide zinc metalloprotease protein
VDASAASVFADKRQRMLVSGVGIMAELFLASVACLLWLRVAPGLIREICFTTMMVGGVSTLLFNGNPLLKFDGYFVLADALEIPNLAARARALMTRGAARLFLGLTTGKHDPARGTERAWLIGYGLVSGTYRIAILALIVWFLAREIPVAGYVLATWVVVLQLARPLWRAVRFVAEHAVNAPGRRAVGARFALCISAALLGLFVLPFPAWGSAEGVIWMSHDRHIKAPVDAFVDRALVTGQTRVTRDQVVMQFAAPDLEARARRVAARVDELEARHGRALFHDRSRLGELTHALDQARTELIDLRTDIAALQVAAPADGEVHFVRARSEPGRYVRQGELVGFVRDARPAVARAVVRQGEIQRLRQAGTAVRVRLPGVGSAPVGATLVDAFGAATNQLPSVALGSAGGGRIATDALDEELRRSAEDIFVVDVQLADGAPALAVGTRVYLRFDFPPAPLARQLLDALRRLTLDQKFT